MNQKVIISSIIIVILLIATAGYFLINNSKEPILKNQPVELEKPIETPVLDVNIEVKPVVVNHEVVYTNSGYAPSSLTIKTGDTVVFKNQSSAQMWTGSAMHPSHMVYSGTNLQAHCPDAENNDFDQCQNAGPGTSWSFTFTKTGEWGYHNHSNSTHFGKITVE